MHIESSLLKTLSIESIFWEINFKLNLDRSFKDQAYPTRIWEKGGILNDSQDNALIQFAKGV